MGLLLDQIASLLTLITRPLELAKGFSKEKSLQLEPWGIIATLSVNGTWKLIWRREWIGDQADAILRWKPASSAHWLTGAIAGRWLFSLKETMAVEGDIAWVLALQRHSRTLPLWLQHHHPAALVLSRSLRKIAEASLLPLIRSGMQDARDTLLEDRYAVSHHHTSRWSSEVMQLYEATERLDARCQLLEKHFDSTTSS